jgi:hypothetical protein
MSGLVGRDLAHFFLPEDPLLSLSVANIYSKLGTLYRFSGTNLVKSNLTFENLI